MLRTAAFVGRIKCRRGGGIIKSLRFFPHNTTANESFERAQFTLIFLRDKTDGVADRVRASAAADAMDIIFRVHETNAIARN